MSTIEGDRYVYETVITDEADTITFRVTFRDLEWLIESFRQALYTLNYQENWDAQPEDAFAWEDPIYDCVGELLQSIEIVDDVGRISPYCVADYPDLPPHVLPCRGETFDREDYPKLWERLPNALKTETTFTTPDIRGHVVGAAGTYSGLSTRTVYQRVGEETHILSLGEIPSHSHSYTPPVANVDLETPGAPDIFAAGIGLPTNTGSAGGDGAHNNMQPTLFLVWGITAR